MKSPVKIAVTGSAGNIAYSLLFRIASGDMLGKDQPVDLHLLEITPSLPALHGVVMELHDSAFPLLNRVVFSDQASDIFVDVDYALLVGARPRSAGMSRADLLESNGKIFSEQGKALNEFAKSTVKVLVVGNPANTNALIAASNAPNIPKSQFSAMTRLDHNRAVFQLSQKLEVNHNELKKIIIWGNHSSTQFPDISHAEHLGKNVASKIDFSWYSGSFIPKVQERGAAIIEARGASSAASAASSAIDHMRNWVLGTPENDWVSMGVWSDGSYGISKDIIYSFPVVCLDGEYKIVQNLELNQFGEEMMQKSEQELISEKSAIKQLL